MERRAWLCLNQMTSYSTCCPNLASIIIFKFLVMHFWIFHFNFNCDSKWYINQWVWYIFFPDSKLAQLLLCFSPDNMIWACNMYVWACVSVNQRINRSYFKAVFWPVYICYNCKNYFFGNYLKSRSYWWKIYFFCC